MGPVSIDVVAPVQELDDEASRVSSHLCIAIACGNPLSVLFGMIDAGDAASQCGNHRCVASEHPQVTVDARQTQRGHSPTKEQAFGSHNHKLEVRPHSSAPARDGNEAGSCQGRAPSGVTSTPKRLRAHS